MLGEWWHNFGLRLRTLAKRRQLHRDLEDEVAFHLAAREEQSREAGMDAQEARYSARRRFGNVTRTKEKTLEMWTFGMLETLYRDFRYALRVLRNKPAFTAVAVLTVAVGIGANSAVFSVVNSVLLKALPYSQEQRLVMIWEAKAREGRDHNVVSPANYLYWQEHNTVFEQTAAFFDDTSTLTGEGDPEEIPSQGISTNLFSLLGISPILGRDFSADEGQRGHNHEVLVSYGLWRRRFGGDRYVVGKTIRLDGQSYQVVGVMPPGVALFASQGSLTGKPAQLWWPYAWTDDDHKPTGRWMSAIGRLKPGVSLAQAQTEMNGLVASYTKTYPDFETGWGVNLVPVHEDLTSAIRPTLLVLLGAVGFVLLITCANISNLLLSRASSREREIAVREALGATRWRILQQSLTESLLLAFLGGALGILAARWALSTVVLLIPKTLHVSTIALDWRMVAFAAGISALTGLAFGLAPAFQAARTDSCEALREAGRSETGIRGHHVRNVFAVAQISLSLVLLAGAGLLLQSFLKLSSVNPGFNPRNLLTLRITLPRVKYSKPSQYIAFFQQLLEQVRALPGVRAATIDNSFPLTGMTPGTDFDIGGKPSPPRGQNRLTEVRLVGSDYFRTMQIPVLRGRTFSDREETVESHVVIVSESLVRQYFPDEDPIGQKVRIDMKDQNDFSEIIGVVGDVKRQGLDTVSPPASYWPHAELPFSSMMLAARTDGDPFAKVAAIRDIVQRMDSDLPLSDIATMDQAVGDSVARQQFSAVMVAIFAGIALFLAAIGIYGVVAYAVSLRIREFGIRMALGAKGRDVWSLVFRQGLSLAGMGVLFGVAGTLALTPLIRGLLFGVGAHDPGTIAAVAAFLMAVALAACWVPAHRATHVDPIVALRYE
ncbi:MAG TPA: ABC transporter permease [Candidatus Methylomirabilis sp.]|nr:ABC transporter permease [Candidatus Methylomirabilis sp.]